MNIIKLSAINSTNDYLKRLCGAVETQNFTIVVADNQTQGRGQMGAQWKAEPGKNLTFSILIKNVLFDISGIFALNAAVAVSIIQALEPYAVPDLSIKWPNDILAGNRKIGGVLIENTIKPDGVVLSITGIGINVNQQNFHGLPRATSLAVVLKKEFDRYALMISIAESIKRNVAGLVGGSAEAIWQYYHHKLYKKGIPMPFEKNDQKFMGIIQGVTTTGSLEVLLEDDTVAFYALKQVQLLY